MSRFPVALRGYDRAEVDALFDRIENALDGGPPLTADQVRRARFRIAVRGYQRMAVDEMLRECMRELQAVVPPTTRPRRAKVHTGWLMTWIRGTRFAGAGLLRIGYDVRDVDAFLDRVISGLRGGVPPLTARDVRECAFRTIRLGPGYDEREVDRFLDQLAAALESP